MNLKKPIPVPKWVLMFLGGWMIFEVYQGAICKGNKKSEKAKVQRLERQIRIEKESAQMQNDIEAEMDRYLKNIGRYDEYIDLSNEGAI